VNRYDTRAALFPARECVTSGFAGN